MPESCYAEIPNKNLLSSPYLETCACIKDMNLLIHDNRLLIFKDSVITRIVFIAYFLPNALEPFPRKYIFCLSSKVMQ